MPKEKRLKGDKNISSFLFQLWNVPEFGFLPLIAYRNKSPDQQSVYNNQLSWSDVAAKPSALEELAENINQCNELIQDVHETAMHGIERIVSEENAEAPILVSVPKTPKTTKRVKKRVSRKSCMIKQPLRRSTRKTKQPPYSFLKRKSGHMDTTTLISMDTLKLQKHLNGYAEEQNKRNIDTADRNDVDGQPEGTEVAAEGTEVAAEGTEVATEGTEVATEGTEVATEGTEVATEGTEVVTEGTEVVTEGTEVVTEGTEVATEGTEVASILEADSLEAIPPLSETPKKARQSVRLSTPMKECLKKKLSVTLLHLACDQDIHQKSSQSDHGEEEPTLAKTDSDDPGEADAAENESGLQLALPESEEGFEEMEIEPTEHATKPRKSILGKHKSHTSVKVLGGLAAKRRSTRQSMRLKVLVTSGTAMKKVCEDTPSNDDFLPMEEENEPKDASQTEAEEPKSKSRTRPKPRIAKPVPKSKKAKPKVTSFLSSGPSTRCRKTPGSATSVSSYSRFMSPMRTPNSGIQAVVKSFILRNTPERTNREAELLEKKRKIEEKQKKEEETARRLEEEKKQKIDEVKRKREARTLRAVHQRELREKEIKEKQHQKQEQWEQKLIDADRFRTQRMNEEAAKMTKQMEKLAKAEAKRKEEEEEKLKRLKEQDEERDRRFQQQLAEKKLAEERRQREKRMEEEKKKAEEERQKMLKLEERMRVALEEEEAANQLKLEAEKLKKKQEQEAKRKKQKEKIKKLNEERAKAQAERELVKKMKLEEKRLAKEKKLLEEQKRKNEERKLLEERFRREQEKEEEAARQVEDALRKVKEDKEALEEEEKRKKLEAAKKREALRVRIEENRRLQEEKLKQDRMQEEMRRKEREYLRQAQEAEERIKKLQVKKGGTAAAAMSSTIAQDKSMLNSTYTKANESVDNYNMTPRGPGRPLLPSTSNNYNIDDFQSDDSTDNEDEPKKVVPRWAKDSFRSSRVAYDSPSTSTDVESMCLVEFRGSPSVPLPAEPRQCIPELAEPCQPEQLV